MTPHKFLLGGDLSLAKRIMDAGGRYCLEGIEAPLPVLLAGVGMNCARLRLFHTPTGRGAQVNDLDYTLDLACRLRAAGLDLYLAPHYSDGWADPSKQFPPAAWTGLSFQRLVGSVYEYSREIMSRFRERRLAPRIVQIGNEIAGGILWEQGRIATRHSAASLDWDPDALKATDKENWSRFAELLKAGVAGAIDGLAPHRPEIMLHIDRGGDWGTSAWFFENIARHDVPHDVIGLSYYPFWHGMPDRLRENCQRLLARFGKGIYMAEMAYPYRESPFYNASLCGHEDLWNAITHAYPLTPGGQRQFVEDVTGIMLDLPGGGGRGAFYWAPEWIPLEGFPDEPDADTCWPRALFDEQGDALPALEAFAPLSRRAAHRAAPHHPEPATAMPGAAS